MQAGALEVCSIGLIQYHPEPSHVGYVAMRYHEVQPRTSWSSMCFLIMVLLLIISVRRWHTSNPLQLPDLGLELRADRRCWKILKITSFQNEKSWSIFTFDMDQFDMQQNPYILHLQPARWLDSNEAWSRFGLAVIEFYGGQGLGQPRWARVAWNCGFLKPFWQLQFLKLKTQWCKRLQTQFQARDARKKSFTGMTIFNSTLPRQAQAWGLRLIALHVHRDNWQPGYIFECQQIDGLNRSAPALVVFA